MSKQLLKLIEEGEHLRQDFKFAINDSKKIARSLAAFANTKGGRLLVGVKDNGRIAGVASDEEYYMIEAAAQIYCNPPVSFTTKEWRIEGKTVLEVRIPISPDKPHTAPDKDGKPKVYIRVEDKNLLANGVLLKVWKKEKQKKGALLRFDKAEKFLLSYLHEHPSITLAKYSKLAHIPRYKAEKILVNFVSMKVVELVITERATFYRINQAGENLRHSKEFNQINY
ncbi:ATP-binding protein [Marinilabiliaceae bacterium JC017]|nr:ATP-binding protein [Marinilabiliaceae bacterium JC017]